MHTSAPLETILAYYNIKPFLKHEDWVELGKKLQVDKKEVEARISGKILEDSFFLIARCSHEVEALISFSEVLSKITDTPSPDGLIVFKNGEKILVEVKSTKDDEWKISRNRVENQKLLADKMQIKLVYAVYVGNFWGVYTPEFLASNNYKVRHLRDIKSSIFDPLFDPLLIKIPKGLTIMKQFSHERDAVSPVEAYSKEYGHVTRYWIRYGNLVRELTTSDSARAFTAIELAISETLRIHKLSNTNTVMISECLMDCYLNDCRLSIDHIQITVSSKNEERYNVSSFLTYAVSALQQAQSIDFAKGVDNGIELIRHLIGLGFPFEISRALETDYLSGMEIK
jgi:hypothetical protein